MRKLANSLIWIIPFLLGAFSARASTPKTSIPQIEFYGQWGYVSNEGLCDREEVISLELNCDRDTKLLEILAYNEYLSVMSLLSDPNYARFLLSQQVGFFKQNSIVEIFSERSCGTIFIDSKKLFSKLNSSQYLFAEIENSCTSLRSVQINNFNVPLHLSSRFNNISQVKNFLQGTNLVKKNNLQVSLLNQNSLRIYNNSLRKNIILGNNFWEKIIIVMILDASNNQITVLLNGQFGTGFNPPSHAELLSSNLTYPGEVSIFLDSFQNEILQ